MSKSWRPTKRQVEIVAECAIARIDTARTAKLLGIDEPMFVSWAQRLAAAAAVEERREAAFLARSRGVAHERAEASVFGGRLP
jgi:hypothetical protein